ncbi:MAG TPA: helix-turn-helix domain-containing protein [Pirellulales bacterium]|jgi:excisionase family DNA binding protein|nr:helix-turn-helix domain-containing protein [Pirellulales bacterium]
MAEEKLALTPDEVCVLVGVSRKTLYNYTAPRGTLVSIHIGAALRYLRADVERWLQQLREKSPLKEETISA